MRVTRVLRILMPWLYFVALVGVVEVIVRLTGVPAYLIPPPTAVAIEAVTTLPVILPHLGITMTEAILGFLGGNLFAVLFGFFFSQLRFMRQGFYPILVGFQAVPILAVAPFVSIWFGPGILGKAIMAGLICYFPATVISTDGFSRSNRDALFLLRSFGCSRWRIFSALQFPSAIPALVSAFEVSATLCTIGAVVAELSGASKGVGYLILMASYEFRTTTLFAVLAVTSFATLALFKTVQILGKAYVRRYTFSYASTE